MTSPFYPGLSVAGRDDRLHAPAADRNCGPILDVLQRYCAGGTHVLEVASGPGQHVARFATVLHDVHWQPSDPDERMRASEAAWTESLPNVALPRALDVLDDAWWNQFDGEFGLVLCINMLHCTERTTVEGLAAGAGRLLATGGHLLIYGPFTFNGEFGARSNRSFDAMLRQQNPGWGLRDVNDIAATAHGHGLEFEHAIAMPSNNHMLVFSRCRVTGQGKPA